MVGKYVELHDAYISVKEALNHAGLFHEREIELDWIHAEDIEREGPEKLLRSASGIVVPGGFGPRGVDGMIIAAGYARERGIPYLGLCLGLQVMVIDYARNVLDLKGANSIEMADECEHPVVDLMPEQISITEKGGTMRLGNYPCRLVAGTKAYDAYKREEVIERHRHRFELNNSYRESLENAGLRASGLSPDGKLVEISEVEGHPFHGWSPIPSGVSIKARKTTPLSKRVYQSCYWNFQRRRSACVTIFKRGRTFETKWWHGDA